MRIRNREWQNSQNNNKPSPFVGLQSHLYNMFCCCFAMLLLPPCAVKGRYVASCSHRASSGLVLVGSWQFVVVVSFECFCWVYRFHPHIYGTFTCYLCLLAAVCVLLSIYGPCFVRVRSYGYGESSRDIFPRQIHPTQMDLEKLKVEVLEREREKEARER